MSCTVKVVGFSQQIKGCNVVFKLWKMAAELCSMLCFVLPTGK